MEPLSPQGPIIDAAYEAYVTLIAKHHLSPGDVKGIYLGPMEAARLKAWCADLSESSQMGVSPNSLFGKPVFVGSKPGISVMLGIDKVGVQLFEAGYAKKAPETT
jgi:hypothetical protein